MNGLHGAFYSGHCAGDSFYVDSVIGSVGPNMEMITSIAGSAVINQIGEGGDGCIAYPIGNGKSLDAECRVNGARSLYKHLACSGIGRHHSNNLRIVPRNNMSRRGACIGAALAVVGIIEKDSAGCGAKT